MTTVKKYTVGYFLRKFAAIPASRWHKGSLHAERLDKKTGQPAWFASCALGHCERFGMKNGKYTPEGKEISTALKGHFARLGMDVVCVNDAGSYGNIVTPTIASVPKTPRARILKALRLIKQRVGRNGQVKAQYANA